MFRMSDPPHRFTDLNTWLGSCVLGRLWNLEEVEPWWRKYVTWGPCLNSCTLFLCLLHMDENVIDLLSVPSSTLSLTTCPLCHDRFCPVGTISQINPFFSHFLLFFSGHFLQQEEKVTYTRIIFVLVNLIWFLFFPLKENICSLSCFPAPLTKNEADTFSCLLIFLLSFLLLRATHDHCPFLY